MPSTQMPGWPLTYLLNKQLSYNQKIVTYTVNNEETRNWQKRHYRTHQWCWSVNQKKIELILTFCPELPLTSALLPGPGPRTGAGRARGGAGGTGVAALCLGCFVSVIVAGIQVILWQVSIFVLVVIVLEKEFMWCRIVICVNLNKLLHPTYVQLVFGNITILFIIFLILLFFIFFYFFLFAFFWGRRAAGFPTELFLFTTKLWQ